LEKVIKTGISKTIETMLKPPIKNLGTKGIQHFANEVAKWPKEYPPRNPHFNNFMKLHTLCWKKMTQVADVSATFTHFLRKQVNISISRE
jgi:hypothetical protein